MNHIFHCHDIVKINFVRGFLVGDYPAGNVLRFDPVLTIEQQSIDQLLDCLANILHEVESPAIA